MQLKTQATAHTEPKQQPHPDKIHAGPRGKAEETDKKEDKDDDDAESKVRPDDFDLPEEDEAEKDGNDEMVEKEEANRPG